MQRLILIFSIIMTIVSSIGVGLYLVKSPSAGAVQGGSNDKGQVTKSHNKLSLKVLVANAEIKEGEQLQEHLFTPKTIEYYSDLPLTNDYVKSEDAKDLYSTYVAASNIKEGRKIEWSDITKAGESTSRDIKLRPKGDMLSFAFPLDMRQWAMLENVGPQELVDIFFKYELDTRGDGSGKSYGIVPKVGPRGSGLGNVNTSQLIPLALRRKVLANQAVILEQESNQYDANQVDEHIKGYLYVELSQDDVKKIYTIENLGDMYIFPSSKDADKKDSKEARTFTTENVLPKEFIKELRGKGKGGNAN